MNFLHRSKCKCKVSQAQFIFALVLCFLMIIASMACVDAYGGDLVQYDAGVPAERYTVETLISHFDDGDVVVTIDPVLEVPKKVPAFVIHAKACAKLDVAIDLLVEVLSGGDAVPGQSPPALCGPRYTLVSRVAAAVALAEIGPDAIAAEPVLCNMLAGDIVERRLAAGVIQGIGPGAFELIDPLMPNLYSEDFHTQYWTCRALAALGPAAEQSVPDLCYLAESGVGSVRRNACIALGEIAPNTAYEMLATSTLENVLSNEFLHPVKTAAREALDKFYANSVD